MGGGQLGHFGRGGEPNILPPDLTDQANVRQRRIQEGGGEGIDKRGR